VKSKLAFALFLVAMLPVVNGSQEVVEMGPYNVSFDLGDLNYSVVFLEPHESETYGGTNYTSYSMVIYTDIATDGFILIQGMSCASYVRSQFDSTFLSYIGSKLYCRTVDNKKVVMFVDETADGFKFNTHYFLESDGWADDDGEFTGNLGSDRNAYLTGSNYIIITSTMNWDVTRQLLNTIHVELRDEGDNEDI